MYLQQISSRQDCTVNYSHHAIQQILRTYSSYNWKFIPFYQTLPFSLLSSLGTTILLSISWSFGFRFLGLPERSLDECRRRSGEKEGAMKSSFTWTVDQESSWIRSSAPASPLCDLRKWKKVKVLVTLWPSGLPPKLLCLWNSPGKNTGVRCHSLLPGI